MGYHQTNPYDRGSALSRSFLPLALITLGVVFLLGNLVPERGRAGLFVLGLGAAFLVGRLTTGRYGYAVPAGILIAIGAYISLQDLSGLRSSAFQGAGAFFVLLGLGFALTYAIGLRPWAIWPLFPATILVGLGLALLGISALGALSSLSWIAAYWPAALVLVGVWLLLRDSLPPPARRPIATLGGLALLAYGILAAAASMATGGALARAGGSPGFGGPAPFVDTVMLEAPIAASQTLVIDNSSGHTTIHAGSGSTIHVEAARHYRLGGQAPEVRLVPRGDGITLESSNPRPRFPFGDSSSVDYTVELPAGVNLRAQSSSGGVSVSDVTGEVRLETSSGGIDATGLSHLREATSSSGSISLVGVFTEAAQVRSSSGTVNLKLLPGSAIQLDVKSNSGRVEPQGGLFLTGGATHRNDLSGALGSPAPGAVLSVQTSSGSVQISQ